MSLSPWTRNYNYLNDYFWTVYQYYNKSNKSYPVNYYSVDYEETVWENENLFGGSYEKEGVGDWSGVKWKKYFFIPVSYIEPMQPNVNSGEKGLEYTSNLITSFQLPNGYGIKPTENDVVDLNYGFNANSPKIHPLFVVTGVNLSHQGLDNQIWQCKVAVAPFRLDQLEKQISTYSMYMNSTNKIHRLNNSKLLLKLEERMDTVNTRLMSLFDMASGFYLNNVLN